MRYVTKPSKPNPSREQFPNYWTQGDTKAEVRQNLLDVYLDLSQGKIPVARRHAELKLA